MPSPTYSAAVTTFVLGCSTPREGTGVGLTALRVQDVVFDLIKPANDSRTLTLRMIRNLNKGLGISAQVLITDNTRPIG